MRVLITSLIVSCIITSLSYYIALDWIVDIQRELGQFVWVILFGMVFIPCFATIFVTTTLLFKQQRRKSEYNSYPPISILVACYNEQDNIIDTIQSILAQNYKGEFEIIIADDGSTDNSVFNINKMLSASSDWLESVELIENRINRGKSAVLNDALKLAKYGIIVTIDSDTILHKEALHNLIDKFMSNDYAAVAGTIRVNNYRKNIVTRLQYWDYMLGIASIKQAQGIYDNTLVAQGAFSCYKKEYLEKLKWSNTMGEDIVLSWDMLKLGLKIGHANDAIVFTNVPENYRNFFKQRKRWSIGLIEAFKRNGKLLITPSKGLPFIWYNLLFPYIDISYMLFFFPSVILAVFFHYYLLAGMLTLLLLPLGLALNLIIVIIQNRINKRVDLGFNNDWVGFFLFIVFYQLIQTPATIAGYLSELFSLKKSWGTR